MSAADRCYLSCTVCGRGCRWSGRTYGRQTHRFDCCGVMDAHVPSRDGATWFRSGPPAYLTGPSQTGGATRRKR